MILILLSTLISQSTSLNVLFISVGTAGPLTSLFELAKAMKNHNVTFLTQQMAKSYINLNSVSSPLFHIIYANDSIDAFSYEKNHEQKLFLYMTNHSLFDVLPEAALILGDFITSLLHKTIHVLMSNHFDAIIAASRILGVSILCEKAQIPCVIHSSTVLSDIFNFNLPDIFNFNLPNSFSFLTPNELNQFTYRIYNAMFNAHVALKLIPKMIPKYYTIFQSLPHIPGPFYDSYTVKNLLFSKKKCLHLMSMPLTFSIPTYSDHYTKHLGAFMDETSIDDCSDDLATWVKSKKIGSILFGAFGSTSLIPYDRMYELVNGLAKFLVQTDDTFMLLAFHDANYDTYRAVLKDLSHSQIRTMLENNERVWIKKGFGKQKWILQQRSVKVFLSHCGMGSIMEALYFAKPILGMPFNAEQFANAIRTESLNVGISLFEPPPRIQNILYPYNVVQYTFTAESVTNKVLDLWMNATYKKLAQQISLEMKHAGGVKRAVEEIEFFVSLNGNLDHFSPFQSTLSFYQRYMLDLLLAFLFVPGLTVAYIISQYYGRQRKIKID